MPDSTEPHDPGDIRATGLWPTTHRAASLGLMVPVSERHTFPGTPHFADIVAISQAGADAGFEALWFADHFSFPDDELRGCWEAWTVMAAVAAAVPDVQVGPMVACTAYRNPGVIAKMSEAIDDISGGRFILGLGAGWQEDEYRQFGMPFEPRVSRFEEAVQIIHGLVREGEAHLQGRFYQANQARNLPRGPRPDGPPILIGSSGERMLSLLTRYADAWNTGGDTDDKLRTNIGKFDAALAEAGRDPADVVRTVVVEFEVEGSTKNRPTSITGGADAQLARLRELEAFGFQHIIIRITPSTPDTIAALAPMVERFYSEG